MNSPEPLATLPETIDPAFAAMLCCPVCADRPRLQRNTDSLLCVQCRRVFRIVNGLPDLRPESGTLPQEGDAPAAPPA